MLLETLLYMSIIFRMCFTMNLITFNLKSCRNRDNKKRIKEKLIMK